ncbi:cytochrome P450 4C1-like isoform X2 [Diabrotica virgifera virgifera]|uniref:Cytochrome P450 4C1-like n=1 Tax=Diabrotica virgifera virgifera TaxID=50390 RepID=A0ABM5JYZ8_DIAVI|nr:cytochrome P450 4C1-like isoform X2 [Diabrotica virgifera virgifera]
MTECNIKLPGSQTVLNESLEKVQTHSAELVEKSLQNITTHLLLLCGLVILMSYLQFLWQNRRLYWYSWKTPGPIGLPYIGIGYKFVSRDISDKVWKIHRRTINQAFNQKVLNTFQDIFLQKSEIFADVLQKEVGNKNIELYTLLAGCTMDMVCETALGVNMNVQISKEVEFVKAINKVLEITSIRTFHVWHQLRFTWKLYPLSREFDKALKDFEDFLRSVISNKRKDFALKSSRKNCSLQNDKALAVEEEPRIAFLDLIDNDNFTERELIDEIKTFFLAAVDTTASTLCSLFAMLGMHPDIQQKVFEEAVDILGPDRRSFPEDIQKMTYLERVLKETLRLFPGIPLLGRRLVEDIDGGDMVFPKGCSIIVGSVFLGRNPAYWPDPLKFDPDRFLPENIAKRHPCAYLPFSYGPRNCIGGKYGMINMKTIVATIIRRFKIFTEYKSVEEIKLSTYLILRLRDGPKVWLEPR